MNVGIHFSGALQVLLVDVWIKYENSSIEHFFKLLFT